MYYDKVEHGKGDGESGKNCQYTGLVRVDLSERVIIKEGFERKGKETHVLSGGKIDEQREYEDPRWSVSGVHQGRQRDQCTAKDRSEREGVGGE